MLVYNHRKFNEKDFESPVYDEAHVVYFPIQTLMPENNVMQLTLGKVNTRQDFLKPFADFDEKEFHMDWLLNNGKEILSVDSKPNAIASVTIEKNSEGFAIEVVAENSIILAVGIFGGIAVVTYMILAELEHCLTNKKFENYLASELYSAEALEPVLEAGAEKKSCCKKMLCCGRNSSVSRMRHHIPSGFHNEVIGENDEILDRSKVGIWFKKYRVFNAICCCTCKRTRIDRIFLKARKLTDQELNITSIIKVQRQSAALC